MHSINRSSITIKPKQLFVDWLNSTPGDDKYTLNDLRKDNLVFLAPEYNSQDGVLKYLKRIFDQIFEWELYGWITDTDIWPQDRTWKMFRDWFEIEINSEVFDLVDKNIVKEEV